MKNLKNSKTSGISLVALIVTIIVLIILTAAVIVTFMEGGIIEKAKEAVFKSDIRTYQEILAVKNAEKQIELATGNGEGGLYNETDYDKIKEIIPEFKEEYKDLIAISNGEIVLGTRSEDPYSIWLADLGIGVAKTSVVALLEVGDYVNYDIPGGTYEIPAEDRRWIYNNVNGEESYEIGYQDIMWKVLKNDGTEVTLVSEESVENIYLLIDDANAGKSRAYLNGPDRLDAICETVYGGRNLKVEDVNEVLKIEPKPSYYNSEGTQVYKELGATFGDAIEEDGYDVSGWDKPENYENIPLYYSYTKSDCVNVGETEKDMIFAQDNYWLSSSSIIVYFNHVYVEYPLLVVDNDSLTQWELYPTGDGDLYDVCGLRPVVTLSASTQIADVTGDGSSADNAWQLK
ncbi:MAG: hypothetical protein E7311_02350 [Clostridiales bacterium]|nr:hypothetical protein [Clostridiales bacterium]